MRKISGSSLSIVINKERMEYISSKNMKELLYSISFSKDFDSDKCQNLSCSVTINTKTILQGATISLEKNKIQVHQGKTSFAD